MTHEQVFDQAEQMEKMLEWIDYCRDSKLITKEEIAEILLTTAMVFETWQASPGWQDMVDFLINMAAWQVGIYQPVRRGWNTWPTE